MMKRKIISSIILSSLLLVDSALVIRAIDNNTSDLSNIISSTGGKVSFEEIDPYFSHYNINSHSHEIDKTGTINKVLVLEANSSADVFTFNTPLNKNDLTKFYNIVEWFIVPSNLQLYSKSQGAGYGDTDFYSFEITLTDKNNKDKYVVFRTENRPDIGTYYTYVAGKVGANGQSVNGYAESFQSINKNWGCTLKASHVGCFANSDAVPSGYNMDYPLAGFLSLDYESKCVYSVSGANYGERRLVRDLDDGSHMIQTDEIWSGFDSDEVEVSIKFNDIVSGRSARVAILGYNGIDFTNGLVDDRVKPELIRKDNLDGKLFGEINKEMPIIDYFSYDNLDGFSNDISYSVFYNYDLPSEKEYAIKDGKFLPNKAGIYTLVVKKTDSSGNTGKELYEIEIINKISNTELKLDSEIESDIYVGNSLKLPEANVLGGTINKNYSIDVIYDGKVIASDVKDSYKVERQGIYTIRYNAIDFYNNPKHFDYYVNATLSKKPIVEFPTIKENIPVDAKYQIPNVEAYDYYSLSDKVLANVNYFVKEPGSETFSELQSNSFTPTKAGKYVLKISSSAIFDKDNVSEKEYEINAINCEEVKDYFILDDMLITDVEGNMSFNILSNDSNISFIKSIQKDNFSFDISFNNNKDIEMIVTLTDSVDVSKKVEFILHPLTNSISELIYNGESYEIEGSLLDFNKSISLTYKNGKLFNGDVAFLFVDTLSNGEKFEGFSNDRFDMNINFIGASSSSFMFNSFCGFSDFSTGAVDISSPVLTVNSLNFIATFNETIYVESSAYDLFDGDCDVSIKVSFENEQIMLTNSKSVYFTTNKYGKYQIRIESSDLMGNKIAKSFNIYCYDRFAPKITVGSKPVENASINEIVNVPSYEVVDNYDEEPTHKVYIRKPDYSYAICQDNYFIPTLKGTYTLIYYAEDSEGNYTTCEFEIFIK